MANIQSAKKDVRRTRKRNLQNSQHRARLRTFDKRIRSLVEEGKVEDAQKAFRDYTRFLDRAGKRNLIHWKQADRKKSRIALLINKGATPQSA